MQTRPTKFAAFNEHVDGVKLWIVKLTDGTTTWLLSSTDIVLTDGHVHALLHSGMSIEFEKAISIFNRRLSISSLNLILNNKPYTHDHKRLSDQGIVSAKALDVTIYAFAGGTAVALSDCHVAYIGRVVETPECDAETIRMTVEDSSAFILRESLPNYKGYGGPMKAIALGDFSGEAEFGSPDWMIKGYSVQVGGNIETQFTQHEISGGDIWAKVPNGAWLKLDLSYMALDGYDVGLLDDEIEGKDVTLLYIETGALLTGTVYLPPSKVDIEDWPTAGIEDQADWNTVMNNVRDGQNALDRNHRTYAEIYQGDDVSGRYIGAMFFRWPDYLKSNDPDDPNRYDLQYWTFLDETAWTLQYKILKNSSLTYDYGYHDLGWHTCILAEYTDVGRHLIYEDSSTVFDGTTRELTLYSAVAGSEFSLHDDVDDLLFDYKDFAVRVLAEVTAASNSYLMRVYDVCLTTPVKTNVGHSTDVELWLLPKGLTPFSAMSGRGAFGEGPTGELNHAAYQTEALLRSVFGFTDTEIDTASFDSAYSASYKSRAIITVDNPVAAGDLFQELAENSNYIFAFDPAGKARAISLTASSPTTVATIPAFDLIGSVKVFATNTSMIVNQMKYRYDYNPTGKVFHEESTAVDSTSQSDYGLMSRPAEFKYIDPEDIANLVGHLVTGADAILDDKHNGIIIQTAGWKYLHLEFGDWIELDATTVDPQLLFNGATWSGEQFMIIGKRVVDRDMVEFTAIQL